MMISKIKNLFFSCLLLSSVCLCAEAANLDYIVNVNEPVTVTGSPRLSLTIGSTPHYAVYDAGGSTTTALLFRYAVQPGDFDADGVVVASPVDLNGGTIRDAGGNDLALTYTPTSTPNVKVQTYQTVFTTDPITTSNETAAAIRLTKAPIGATFNYTITSSGGPGSVIGSGTIATAIQDVTNIDVSTLPYGTLTVSVTMADASGTGAAKTDTVTGSVSGLLDGLSPDAVYSVRRLLSSYTGPLLRVRRSSDNTETDIHSTFSGNISTTEINNFCAVTNCFVTTWYDQSGNGGRNGIQSFSGNQPYLVSNGTVYLKNGKVTIKHFAASNHYLRMPSNYITSNNFTVNVVEGLDGTANHRMLSSAGSNWLLGLWNGNAQSVYFEGTGTYSSGVPATTNIESYIAIGHASATASLYRNGVDYSVSGNVTSARPASDFVTSSYQSSSEFSDGYMSELIVWNSAMSPSTMLTIYNDQKTYFGTP